MFDWLHDDAKEENLRFDNDEIRYFIVYKETQKAYSENTNQLNQNSYCIHIYSPIQLTNLLPVHIQYKLNVCSLRLRTNRFCYSFFLRNQRENFY